MGLPFLLSRGRRRDNITAIDLGGHQTKAVFVRRDGESFCLCGYAVVDAPRYEKGFSAEVLTEHLRHVSKVLGPQTKEVSLALGVENSLFRHAELPLAPTEDMRTMLKFNSKNYLQQELPDHVFDCFMLPIRQAKPTGDGTKTATVPNRHKVLVGAAKRSVVEQFESSARSAGLFPEQIVPSAIGPANAFELSEPEMFNKEVVALIDIGFMTTTISILDKGDLLLHRVVNMGGNTLTIGLAEAMSISPVEAENIKIGMPAEVQAELEAQITPLGRELRASIDFFEHNNDKPVSQAFVSGGTSRNEFILSLLQNELMLPCKLWNPAQALRLDMPDEQAGRFSDATPQLAVSLGAALAAF